MKIGVLSVQGAFDKHVKMLRQIGVEAIQVRTPEQLSHCAALVIPGGESTVMVRHLAEGGLRQAIEQFASTRPLFGTCAGLILMARNVIESEMPTLGLIDVTVQRNAYGRQVDSFTSPLEVHLKGRPSFQIPATFIRAPKIVSCSSDVEVLASYRGEPVLVRQSHHLAAAFHPELSDNVLIHQYFVEMAAGPCV
jgi:5'-phosphate synthase pdxT subunit